MSKIKNMTKKERMAWYLQRDFEFMIILSAIFLVVGDVDSVKTLIKTIVFIVLLVIAIICSKKQSIAAPIIGITVGLLMIITGVIGSAVVSILLGIFLTAHSIVFLSTSK